jgi:lactate racemase
MEEIVALRFGGGTLRLPNGPFRLEPATAGDSAPQELGPAGLRAALERPLASPTLQEIAHGARRVLVVVSDGTRATGAHLFLPELVARVREGSPRAEIRFAVASGIHRLPTHGEIRRILGEDLASSHEVLRHDPDDPARLIDLGRTRSGTPVRVNRALEEHDRLILTGAVGFHYYAGFSGGRKAVVPGLAARETVTRNHLRALRRDGTRHPAARAGVLQGNPVHRDMAEAAALVGPHFLVNAVIGHQGGIERLFAGQWRRAHEAACRHVRSTRTARVVPRDLVVASAGGEPSDLNLIQAHKAWEAAWGAIRPGGVFVLVARCREGAGHETFLPWLRHETEEALVQALRRDFQVYGQTALSWFRKARTCRAILVSGLPPELVRGLGVEPATDLAGAFDLARRTLREGTAGWLVEQGSRYLLLASGPKRHGRRNSRR